MVTDSNAILYIAMSFLSSKKNSLIPELLAILDIEQISTFIKMYGGESLKIPSPEEFHKDLIAATAAYYIIAENRDWTWIAEKYDLNGHEIRSIRTTLERWLENARPEEIEFLKNIRVSPYDRREE
jgi:hypothetical protein